jgi:hypothetical protein
MCLRAPTKIRSSEKAQASQARFQCVRIHILFIVTITFMPQLGGIEIKTPYFHFRPNYDQLIRDQLESRTSFELIDLLPNTFCLSTIFAEEQAHLLEGCINQMFKGKILKKKLTEICTVADAADEVCILLRWEPIQTWIVVNSESRLASIRTYSKLRPRWTLHFGSTC